MFKNLFKKKENIESAESSFNEMEMVQKQAKTNQDEEVIAAIGLALNLYLQEMHDYEQMVLTIQRVMRPYSPWSSKIYGLRQYPRR